MPISNKPPPWSAPYRIRVALRLLRTRWINLISIAGVMLGVGSIIVVMSVMDGFQHDLRNMIRGTLSDMIVEIFPSHVSSYREVKKNIEAIDGVKAITLQYHTFGAVPGKNRSHTDGGLQSVVPLRLVGIIPTEEAKVSRIHDQLVEAKGHPADDPFALNPDLIEGFLPAEMPRIVISEWLAKKLGGPRVGDEIGILHFEQVVEGGREIYRMHDRDVVISRVYKSGNSEYDQLHVYVDLTQTGKVFFPTPDYAISELRVSLDDYSRAETVREDIARVLAQYDRRYDEADAHEFYIRTWEERQQNLLGAVENEKHILAIALFFIVIVACFTIFATLTMMVVEKTRDIGVLRALGATPGGILSIFVINGTLVGTFGAVLGYGLGIVVANNVNPIRLFLRNRFDIEIFPPNIYLFDDIPTYIDHTAAITFAVGAGICALIFAIIPAVRASRLQPVKALRFE